VKHSSSTGNSRGQQSAVTCADKNKQTVSPVNEPCNVDTDICRADKANGVTLGTSVENPLIQFRPSTVVGQGTTQRLVSASARHVDSATQPTQVQRTATVDNSYNSDRHQTSLSGPSDSETAHDRESVQRDLDTTAIIDCEIETRRSIGAAPSGVEMPEMSVIDSNGTAAVRRVTTRAEKPQTDD